MQQQQQQFYSNVYIRLLERAAVKVGGRSVGSGRSVVGGRSEVVAILQAMSVEATTAEWFLLHQHCSNSTHNV